MQLVEIPSGEFWMGSQGTDRDALFSEQPRHRVRISRPFLIGAREVTQEQYEGVSGENPSEFQRVKGVDTGTLPVERVSWNEATAFCELLSQRPEEAKAGRAYRLPTEAEWEYACRAGTETRFYFGDELKPSQANFHNPAERTTSVGSYAPNAFGLYDMHGNVWEWCADWYSSHFYQEAGELEVDPLCRQPSSVKVGYRSVRGGGWIDLGASSCRSAERRYYEPSDRYAYLGFRVVCELRTDD